MEISSDISSTLDELLGSETLKNAVEQVNRPSISKVSINGNTVIDNTKEKTVSNVKDIDPATATMDDVKKFTLEFTQRYINLQLEIKKIKADIKALKTEYAEQGLGTTAAIRALNTLMRKRKMSSTEQDELETIGEWLANSQEISDGITSLQAKE